MSYTNEMKVLVQFPIGCFSKENLNIFWAEYQNNNLKTGFINLYLIYN